MKEFWPTCLYRSVQLSRIWGLLSTNCFSWSFQSIWISFKVISKHPKPWWWFSLYHFEVDLLVCLGSLSCWIIRVHSSFRAWTELDFLVELNSWFHQLQYVGQVLKQQSSPRSSHHHHYIWLLTVSPTPLWITAFTMVQWSPKDSVSKLLLSV